MSIISSEIILNRSDSPDGFLRRVIEVHTDHLNIPHQRRYSYSAIINPSDYPDEESYQTAFAIEYAPVLAKHANDVDEFLQDAEVSDWIAAMEEGQDPAHIDMGGWFENSVPDYLTWEDCVKRSITPFLQHGYMQEILKTSLTWSRLTKAEGEAIAGKNNPVSGETAIAINTQAELDNYIPLIDEDGNPRA